VTLSSSSFVKDAKIPQGFSTRVFASTDFQPRGIFVTEEGDVLAVERTFNPPRIVRYVQNMNNTWSDESHTIASADGLNHGLA
jgi:hypothetical protein